MAKIENNRINEKEFIERLSTSLGIEEDKVKEYLEAFSATVKQIIAEDKKISISGLGSFTAPTKGWEPENNEGKSKTPKFKQVPHLKEELNPNNI